MQGPLTLYHRPMEHLHFNHYTLMKHFTAEVTSMGIIYVYCTNYVSQIVHAFHSLKYNLLLFANNIMFIFINNTQRPYCFSKIMFTLLIYLAITSFCELNI